MYVCTPYLLKPFLYIEKGGEVQYSQSYLTENIELLLDFIMLDFVLSKRPFHFTPYSVYCSLVEGCKNRR
jgi:hypothetical protein